MILAWRGALTTIPFCTPLLLPFMLDFYRAHVYCFSWIFSFSKISVNIYGSLTFGLIYAFIIQKFSQIFYHNYLYQHIFLWQLLHMSNTWCAVDYFSKIFYNTSAWNYFINRFTAINSVWSFKIRFCAITTCQFLSPKTNKRSCCAVWIFQQ